MADKHHKTRMFQAGENKAPPAAIIRSSDGALQIELQTADLPSQQKFFAADVVLVQDIPPSGIVHLYFTALSPSLKKARAAIRVRFFRQDLVNELERERNFNAKLQAYLKSRPIDPVPGLPAEDLDDLPSTNYASLDGSFMTMAFLGDSAMCDIYSIPPNFVILSRAGTPPAIEAVLRITMPSRTLQKMIDELSVIVSAEGGNK